MNDTFRPYHPISLGLLLQFYEDTTIQKIRFNGYHLTEGRNQLAECIMDEFYVCKNRLAQVLYALRSFLSRDIHEFIRLTGPSRTNTLIASPLQLQLPTPSLPSSSSSSSPALLEKVVW